MVDMFCMACGAAVSPGQRFCTECGAPLHESDGSGQAVPDEPPVQGDNRTLVIPQPRGSQGADDATTMISLDVSLRLVRGATGEERAFHAPAVIGKGTAADLRIDGNSAISRRHARIDSDGALYYLTDLDSMNGTFVGGRQLSPDCPVEVHNGSIIRLADEDFTLLIERRPAKS